MADSNARPPLLTNDTIMALVAVTLASVLAWWWLIAQGHVGGSPGSDMAGMPGMETMPTGAWTFAYALSVFAMWSIMMVAMMLPSAAPMILLHARAPGAQWLTTMTFTLSYLAVWTGFSAVATAGQWWLASNGWLNDEMQLHDNAIEAVLLAGAGLYQLTPLKQLCLRHCRSPLTYLLQHWQPGMVGAFRMGLGHGSWCVACCWFIMALLFVGGVMNIAWIAVLAAFVMIERLLPFGDVVGKAAGLASLAFAGYLLLTPV